MLSVLQDALIGNLFRGEIGYVKHFHGNEKNMKEDDPIQCSRVIPYVILYMIDFQILVNSIKYWCISFK